MANNNSGSQRTGSSPSSRYNSSGNQRPGRYSERYNKPNPYTGYLPPGTASADRIYHPESVDPVRIKQLEREQEQARLHAYEERANMSHSGEASPNNNSPKAQNQSSRSQSNRSAQEAARRGKQTRRAQVAMQQAARASANYRGSSNTDKDQHLNEIRQSAIDEAERLRTAPPIPSKQMPPPAAPVSQSEPEKDITAAFPVAGAAQFAAVNNKKRKKNPSAASVTVPDTGIDEKSNEDNAGTAVIPIVIPSSAVEVITADEPDIPEETAAATSAEEAGDATDGVVILSDTAEPFAEDTPDDGNEESADEPAEDEHAVSDDNEQDEAADIPAADDISLTKEQSSENENADIIADDDAQQSDISDSVGEEAEADEEISDDISDAEAEEELSEADSSDESAELTDADIPDENSSVAETENDTDEEDDIKVYTPSEKNAVETEHDETDSDSEPEYEDDAVVTLPTFTAPTPAKRRNFETRISSELADPSAYSPGVAQDETLFIRKKRPEEATAVFSASTPGLAPDFDDDDFFEQWLEEGDDMIIKDKRQRRRASAIIGGVTMAFAIIGFIFVVVWFIKGIPSGSNSSGSQTDYAKFILPVVNADPEPFETITSVDNNILVEAAINRLTYGEAANDQTYTALEVENETRLLIPAADVEKSGKVLFGSTFAIDYTVMYAIEDEMIYYYSAADNCFHVVTTSGDIEPEIIKISHIGSRTQVLLEVGYISATEETMEGSEYYKEMEYVLNALDDGSYYVSAIRALEK